MPTITTAPAATPLQRWRAHTASGTTVRRWTEWQARLLARDAANITRDVVAVERYDDETAEWVLVDTIGRPR